MASLLERIPGAPTRTYCTPREDPPCDLETSWEVPGTCLLSYSLEGEFEITDAPIAAGNSVNAIGPGRLVVRVPSSGGVSPVPAAGNALLLCYQMHQGFDVAGVITVTQGSVRVPSSGPGASGTFSTGATPQITWNECTYNPLTHVDDDWTPDAAASGPGCTHGYSSTGDVICTLGVVCGVGGLAQRVERGAVLARGRAAPVSRALFGPAPLARAPGRSLLRSDLPGRGHGECCARTTGEPRGLSASLRFAAGHWGAPARSLCSPKRPARWGRALARAPRWAQSAGAARWRERGRERRAGEGAARWRGGRAGRRAFRAS
jgi:hypothetical protein